MHRSRTSHLRAGVLVICGSFAMADAAAAQDAALVKKGQEAFGAQKCAVCHSIGGKGSKSNPLDGVGCLLYTSPSPRDS